MEAKNKIVEQLKIIRGAIDANKNFVSRLPVFARGFAEQDFAGNTGMGFNDWLNLLDKVIGKLEKPTEPAGDEAKDLANDCIKLSTHLERYARYLMTVPDKIRMASSFFQVDEAAMRSAMEAPKFAESVRSLKQDIDSLIKELQARA